MNKYNAGKCDIAVIGAGHAGIEAALAAARLGLDTVCFTVNLDSVGNMPCNPAIGGTGGSRMDHTIANIQSLLFLVSRCARGRMYGDGVIYRVIHDERISFPASCQGTLSLFCMDGQARGVSISGLKYSLDNYTVSSCFPIGVSNSFTGSPAEIEVKDGTLLIISAIQGDNIE